MDEATKDAWRREHGVYLQEAGRPRHDLVKKAMGLSAEEMADLVQYLQSL